MGIPHKLLSRLLYTHIVTFTTFKTNYIHYYNNVLLGENGRPLRRHACSRCAIGSSLKGQPLFCSFCGLSSLCGFCSCYSTRFFEVVHITLNAKVRLKRLKQLKRPELQKRLKQLKRLKQTKLKKILPTFAGLKISLIGNCDFHIIMIPK